MSSPAPMETTIRLPHGYSVKLIMDAEKGLNFDWTPAYPKFKSERASRKFWSGYFRARDAFMQRCANAWQMVVPCNGQDGLKFYRPNAGMEALNIDRRAFAMAVHFRDLRVVVHLKAAEIDGMIAKVDEVAETSEQVAGIVADELLDGALDGEHINGALPACLLWLCLRRNLNGPEMIRLAREGGLYLEAHIETDGSALAISFRNGVRSMTSVIDKVAAEKVAQGAEAQSNA